MHAGAHAQPRANANFNFSDPFVLCQLQGKPKMRFRTRTMRDCRHPVWNHSYLFTDWDPHDELQFSVMDEDEDNFDGDDVLGTATFTSDMLDEHAHFLGVLPLQDHSTDAAMTRRASRGSGHLKVSVQVEMIEDDDPFQEFRTRPRVRQSAAMHALQAEVNELQQVLPETVCRVDLVDCDLFNWELALAGPSGTPYEGGMFRFLLSFPHDYPATAPRLRCATQVFHCNIDHNGTVCPSPVGNGDALQLVMGLMSLLSLPLPEQALVLDVAELFATNRPEHDRRARDMTLRCAT